MSEVVIKFAPKEKKATQPGLGSTLYVALKEWFEEIKEAPATGTNAGDTKAIVDTHTFKNIPGSTTKKYGFIEIPLLPVKTGDWAMKQDGEQPSVITSTSFNGNATGLSKEQAEWIESLTGLSAIVLIEEKECKGAKKRVQIGCNCNPVANIKFNYDSKDNILKMEGMAECTPEWYEGAVSKYQY